MYCNEIVKNCELNRHDRKMRKKNPRIWKKKAQNKKQETTDE